MYVAVEELGTIALDAGGMYFAERVVVLELVETTVRTPPAPTPPAPPEPPPVTVVVAVVDPAIAHVSDIG